MLRAGDAAHGVMEGEALDLDEEVDGVAGHVAIRPAPVVLLEGESGMGVQEEVARLAREGMESELFKQRRQRGDAGGADLFFAPAGLGVRGLIRGGVGHALDETWGPINPPAAGPAQRSGATLFGE